MEKYSWSKVSTFLTCRKKYYWQYIRKLVSKVTPGYFTMGKLFHRGVAGLDPEQPADAEATWYKVGLLARRHWNVQGMSEVKRMFELNPGVQVTYIADLVEDGWLREYKTTMDCSPENFQAHAFSLQLRLGVALFGLKGASLRFAKKPQIRQKKNESEGEFEKRYLDEFINDPAGHFLQVDTPVTPAGAVLEFLSVVEEMNMVDRKGIYVMAPPHICKGKMKCPYMDLCADEPTNIALYEEKQYVEDNTEDE